MKIMIIDDSDTMRKIVKMNLKGIGTEITEAVNGQDALDKLNDQPIDLFLVDFNMPIMNGLEFGLNLRKLDLYKTTPLIYLTTESDQGLDAEKEKIGVTGWLSKPFKKEELMKLIQ
ncbi:MAG: response regulator [Spirochaetes bacterium]|nr:response regulator [Spirochaetota bacterium]